MIRPNFFIVGAPKCGTDSMYQYLRSHPAVFMPEEKEPHYFTTDLPAFRRMDSEENYLALFSGATSEHHAVGEASVWYLFSKDALPAIRVFNPKARILVIFRNPVEFVQSLHAQTAYNKGLDPNFAAAWADSTKRERLAAKGMFGEQFRRLSNCFPSNQILVVILDDLRTDPRREYLRILEFLGIQNDGRTDFAAHNLHKVHHSPRLARFIKHTPAPITGALRFVKGLTGIQQLGWMDRLKQLNTKPVKRQPLDPALRQTVYDIFADDIAFLGHQLGRDLSHWT